MGRCRAPDRVAAVPARTAALPAWALALALGGPVAPACAGAASPAWAPGPLADAAAADETAPAADHAASGRRDLAAPSPAAPPLRAFVQAGVGEHAGQLALGAAWAWRRSRALGRGRLSGAWELALGHWRGTAAKPASGVTQLGLTPLLRWTPADSPWFAEAGIGLHLVSPRYRNGDKRFSTRLNFGDVLAVGRRLGPAGAPELSLRLQHFSNGGLRRPNPGENFLQLRLAWSL